jgi:hypothetical protein
VVSISLATEDTEDHFGGQPIYGLVDSLTDENGNDMIEGGTTTTGNVIGGVLGNLLKGVEGLSNDTGQ